MQSTATAVHQPVHRVLIALAEVHLLLLHGAVLLIKGAHHHPALIRVLLPTGATIAIQPRREAVQRAGVLPPIPHPAEAAALLPVLLVEAAVVAADVVPEEAVAVAHVPAVVAGNRTK